MNEEFPIIPRIWQLLMTEEFPMQEHPSMKPMPNPVPMPPPPINKDVMKFALVAFFTRAVEKGKSYPINKRIIVDIGYGKSGYYQLSKKANNYEDTYRDYDFYVIVVDDPFEIKNWITPPQPLRVDDSVGI